MARRRSSVAFRLFSPHLLLVILPLLCENVLCQVPTTPDIDTLDTDRLVNLVEGDNSVGFSVLCTDVVRSNEAVPLVLRWTFNGEVLPLERQQSETLAGANIFFSNTLDLNVRGTWLEADAGTYGCTARNNDTNETSAARTFQLVINVRPEVLSLAGQESRLEEDVTLTCTTRATLPLNFTWSRGGTVLQTAAAVNSNNNTFTLTNVSRTDTGNYTCRATNRFGSANDTAVVNVIEVPDLGDMFAPQVSSDNLRQILLEWTTEFFDGNTPILSYGAMCTGIGYPGDVQLSDPLTIPATARNATIDNLHPGRSYYCVLAVTNEVGSSTSQTVNATVMEEAPDLAPAQPTVTVLSSTSVEVEWTGIPPASLFGVLRGYTLSFAASCAQCPCSSYPCSQTGSVNVEAGVPLRRVLDGLRRFTEYSVTVAAYNNAGTGPISVAQTVTTSAHESDAPEALMAMPEQNTSAMSVTFREPIEPNGNIVRYELTYESLDTDFQIRPETLVVEDVDTTPIRTRVVGLRRLTAYRFTLRAVNSLGPGLPAVATATMAAFPIIPVMPEAMAVSRGAEVTLSCGSEGDPAPTVTWRRQGNLTSVPGQADGSLVVSNVQESDAGTYICTARNTWGVATGNASITVVGETSSIISGFKDTYLYLCIAGGVLLILLLMTLCLLRCRRKRSSASKTSTNYHFDHHEYNVGAGMSLHNPNYTDPTSEQGSPSYPPRYAGTAGPDSQQRPQHQQQRPVPAQRTPGVGLSHSNVPTISAPNDALDGHFNQTAATFQAQDGHNADHFRKTVTPVATLNNQHQHQPSMLSNASSFHPAQQYDAGGVGASGGGQSKYATNNGNNLHQEMGGGAAGGGPMNTDAYPMRDMAASTDVLTVNEQLPTYTARHGDHILTAM
eukprot:scpid20119/ scgid0500/ Down syndrome cell adhesion molecule-like protein 1 homolog